MSDDKGSIGNVGSRFFATQDELRGGPAPDLCTPDYQAFLGGNPPMDRAGHEAFAKGFYAAFPDMHHEIQDVLLDGSRAAVRFVIHGTHKGSFFGIPATHRDVKVIGHAILHLDEGRGRVRKLLAVFDEAGLLRQLGVLPVG